MKRIALSYYLLLLLILFTNCFSAIEDNSTTIMENSEEASELLNESNIISSFEAAITVYGLKPEQVLYNEKFLSGTLGDKQFHGGKVLVWYHEPTLLRVKASLDLGQGEWRGTNVTGDLVTVEDIPFGVSEMILNDAEIDERKVPLWVFWGYTNDPNIKSIRVRLSGIPDLENKIQNNVWLAIFQGILRDINKTIVYEALDTNGQVLYTKEPCIPTRAREQFSRVGASHLPAQDRQEPAWPDLR